MAKKDPVQIADEFIQTGGDEAAAEQEPVAPKWVKFDEIRPLISELIQAFPEQLAHVKPASIGCAAFSKKRSKVLAKIYPMRPMFGLFSTVDYILAVHAEQWVIATISKKYVLIFHELLHIPIDGFNVDSKSYRKTVDHDVKDFEFILRQFGIDWEESEKIIKKLPSLSKSKEAKELE